MVSIEECGLMLEPQLGMTVEEIITWAKYAEKSGYGYVMRSDHLLPTGRVEERVNSPECWASLGAIGSNTTRIRFGPLVSPIGWRNPALLARMANTLHTSSAGRLVLGIGGGWSQGEYLEYGYEFPKFRTRIEQLVEAAKIIRPLTQGKEVDFKGKHYSAHTALPAPEGSIHLIVGGRNKEVVRIAAEFADEWNMFSPTIESFRKAKNSLPAARKNIVISWMSPFILGESTAGIQHSLSHYSKLEGRTLSLDELRRRGVPCGRKDEFIEQVKSFKEAGVQRFYFDILDPKDKQMIELLTDTLKATF